MLTTFLAILVYLIGCVLAYGRLYASEALIDAKYPELPPANQPSSFIDGIIWFSWLSFFVGVFIYFQDERGQPYARFLRFHNQDIREQHLANPQAAEWRRMGLIEDISIH